MVLASLTNGATRLRDAREQNRVSSWATSSTVRPGAKMALRASLEQIGARDRAAGGPQRPERLGLVVSEVLGALEQRPAGVLEALGRLLVAQRPELVPVLATHLVQRL
jgi:hypothetical protein